MRWKHVFLSLAILGMGAMPVHAVPISLKPSSDTSILATNPDTNYDNPSYLYLIGNASGIRRSMLKFDLSSYAGQTVVGSGTLQLTTGIIGTAAAGRTVDAYPIFSSNASWTETGATWNNLLESSLTTDTTDSDKPWVNADGGGSYSGLGAPGEAYAATPVITATIPSGEQLPMTFTIPAAIIQNWIDHPSDNAGLLLRLPSEIDADSNKKVYFFPAEYSYAGYHPKLTFTTIVPEPATGALMLIGGGLLTFRRRR
jgi:hypothetical protein